MPGEYSLSGGLINMQRQWQIQPAEILGQGPVVPVMVIHTLAQAVPLARALVAGGIRVLEITLRTPVAIEAIRTISREVEGVLVGAGTVTNGDELGEVAAAGAVFAISPGLTVELLDAANQGPIPLIPGIATVSELMSGMARGYSLFKFFPAEAGGGVKILKAFAGPFSQAAFCPPGVILPATTATTSPCRMSSVSAVRGSHRRRRWIRGIGHGLPRSPERPLRNLDVELYTCPASFAEKSVRPWDLVGFRWNSSAVSVSGNVE
jgi:2-dehydro-3-deoxyphosphogluconate aldolase/(4S)-4-hydroxy-2-oxoglutarate aldolase